MTQPNDICPVCGMKAKADVPSVEHHKMYFHFCSEQRRETFVATPASIAPRLERGETRLSSDALRV